MDTRAMYTHKRESLRQNLKRLFSLTQPLSKLGARVGVWAVEGERGGGYFLAKICPLRSQTPGFPPVSPASFFPVIDHWEVPPEV